jgi:hypothetical protein
VNHGHDAETYDDSEGAVLGRIHIERSFQGDLEGKATAELLTATAENGAAVYLALDGISGWLVEEVEVSPRSRSWRRHRIRRAGGLRLCPSSQATLGAEIATADTTAARRDTASYSQG